MKELTVRLELSESELVLISMALREWRTNVPARIAECDKRLANWRETKDAYDDVRLKLDAKFVEELANIFDKKNLS